MNLTGQNNSEEKDHEEKDPDHREKGIIFAKIPHGQVMNHPFSELLF